MKNLAPTVAILLFLSSACRVPTPSPTRDDPLKVSASVEVHPGIVYASADGHPLRLDLFRPKDALNPAPGIVFIHGARPRTRDRHHYQRLAADVAARGIVAATIDYRAYLAAAYPTALNDARAAVTWMNDNADQYGLLPGAVAAGGEFFGGYLAALLGVGSDVARPDVGAVVGIHAVLDPTRFQPVGQPEYAYEFHLFLRHPRAERPDLWERMSPIHNVNPRSSPFLLAHVDGHRVPIDQSKTMIAALRQHGVAAELFAPAVPGATLVNAPHDVPGLARSIANFVLASLWSPPKGVRMIEDIVYASPEGRNLTLDLFLPASTTGPVPVVLVFHGGGWTWGGKTDFREQCVYLATQGFAAACVEYRLARERVYPAAVDDAKAAVRWMRTHAAEFGVDSTRIVAMGMSAGGHLAALLGVTPEKSHFERGDENAGVSTRVSAVVAIAAVVDVVGFDQRDPWSARIFMGGRPHEAPDRWAEASPTNHVRPSAAPFLFLHAMDDEDVAYSDAVVMQQKLEQAGVRAEMFAAASGGHSFFRNYPWRLSAMERVIGFLKSVLDSTVGPGSGSDHDKLLSR
jgi:acetyl esterase/lipase